MAAPPSTVFLSYRRQVSWPIARLVFQHLRDHAYDVFMDVESIDSGQFAPIIRAQIAARAHFLVILTPGALDGCQQPDDWLRREIECAMELRRNIVPILVDDFRFDATARAHLTGKLGVLPDYNGLPLHQEYFDAAMERLRMRFLKQPVQGVITPTPPQDAAVVQQKIAKAARQSAPTPTVPSREPSPIANAPAPPTAFASSFTNSIGMEFVLIRAGTFLMGSLDSDAEASDWEKPAHRVTISQPFYLGKYPVTQAQWEAVMGHNPSRFKGNPNRPVEYVSWDDVQGFLRKLTEREGEQDYRLPSEAEWEYACRAGTETPRYHPNLKAIAWYDANSGGFFRGRQSQPVGKKLPNAWGLYDMLGNVSEWCHDGKREYTADTVIDPMGPTGAGADRIVRGGTWRGGAQGVRAAGRGWPRPGYRYGSLGFRCASSSPST
jgi:formylglycine-generating enzyme required for sulfatase activity